MRQQTRTFTLVLLAILAVVFLAACEPEPAEAPEPEPTANEVEDQDAALGNTAPSEDSPYENVTIWVDSAETTGAESGAAAGSLVLTLTIQNTADESQTLELTSDDFVVLTADGSPLEAVIISETLQNPEIDAGDSVTGTAEFSTLDVGSTYTLQIEGFEDIAVDASVAPEPLD